MQSIVLIVCPFTWYTRGQIPSYCQTYYGPNNVRGKTRRRNIILKFNKYELRTLGTIPLGKVPLCTTSTVLGRLSERTKCTSTLFDFRTHTGTVRTKVKGENGRLRGKK